MRPRPVARVLIADDHRLMAEACKNLLLPDFDVVAVVTDGRALVQAALELNPDVAVIDISMPQLNGLDAAEQIKRKCPRLKVVFLTMNSDPALAAEAFRRGASGYVLKHSSAEDFVSAIRRVVRGESYLSPLIARETMTYLMQLPTEKRLGKHITARQAEILQLLAEGRSMKEVAYVLSLSPGTVAFHKYNMMERLGITTNAGLLQYALQHHMIPAHETYPISSQ